MFEHEAAYLLAVNTKGLDSCGARPNEITHRFVPFIGNPHRSYAGFSVTA